MDSSSHLRLFAHWLSAQLDPGKEGGAQGPGRRYVLVFRGGRVAALPGPLACPSGRSGIAKAGGWSGR